MSDRRPGTKGASALLRSATLADWLDTLQQYEEAVSRVAQNKQKSELISLNAWLWEDFPRLVQGRSPAVYCTKEELTHIMQWKLLRGKNRPALLNLIKQNSESSVESVSKAAFQTLGHSGTTNASSAWKEALMKLTQLRGVGPATASAILAPLDSSIPFMADEVLEAVTHKKRDYTLAAYSHMHSQLQELSQGALGTHLSPEETGKALWTAAMLSIHPPASGDYARSNVGKVQKKAVSSAAEDCVAKNHTETPATEIETEMTKDPACLNTKKRKQQNFIPTQTPLLPANSDSADSDDSRSARRLNRARCSK